MTKAYFWKKLSIWEYHDTLIKTSTKKVKDHLLTNEGEKTEKKTEKRPIMVKTPPE